MEITKTEGLKNWRSTFPISNLNAAYVLVISIEPGSLLAVMKMYVRSLSLRRNRFPEATEAGILPTSGICLVLQFSVDDVKNSRTCSSLQRATRCDLLLQGAATLPPWLRCCLAEYTTGCESRLLCINTYTTAVPTDDLRCVPLCNCSNVRFVFQTRHLHC